MEDFSSFDETKSSELPLVPVEAAAVGPSNSSELTSPIDGGDLGGQQTQGIVPVETAANVDNPSEVARRLSISEIIRNRWEKMRYRNLSRGQQEVLFWGSAAVVGALYPFTGGVSHQALEASKEIAGFEGLFGIIGLEGVAAKKFIDITRR